MATPIGNLRDITLRALDVLKRADVVAAEDTRVTGKLLEHYQISTKLAALHEHNEARAIGPLLALLEEGKSVALVSDAGTPGISDPGAKLIGAARAAGHSVSPIPGANAAIAALSACGVPISHFLFYGFPPARASARRNALGKLAGYPYTLVFFEAPHRIVESVADMALMLGATRTVIIARELTKLFESIHACALLDAVSWLEADPNRRKGEFVLVVEGARTPPERTSMRATLEVLLAELPLKQAVALTARLTGEKRNRLYELALEMKAQDAAAT